MRLPALLLLLLTGCWSPEDPFAWADQRYTDLKALVNAASRDCTRNIFNQDARRRKVEAQQALLAFFRDPRLEEAIEEAREAPEGSLLRQKGEAYEREAVYVRSWKPEEKERETELLAQLDALAGAEASWVDPTGRVEIPLNGSWVDVSRAADSLSPELREDLAEEYVDHRMSAVGETLKELILLRNKVARREGFEDYWHLALYHRGLEPEQVESLVQDLHPVVQPVNHAIAEAISAKARELGLPDDFANHPYLRRLLGFEEGHDQAEPYFDTDLAEDRVLRGLRDMGLRLGNPEIYSGPSRYTVRGAYSFPIRLPEIVSIVISRDERYDLWYYEALVHELGYVSWWRALGPEALASPPLWEPPAAFMEGYAQVFERIFYDVAWLSRYVSEMPVDVRRALNRWRTREVARQVTEAIVQTAVEQRMYSDPNNWGAIARYCSDIEQAYDIYPGQAPTSESGVPYCEALLVPLIWHYPAYAQNYVFAYVTEATLYDAIQGAVGDPVFNPRVGPWLESHIISQGGIGSFPERLAAVSRSEDRLAAFRNYLEGALPAREEPGGD